MQSRVRDVKQAMRHDGTPCGSLGETKQCNVEACEKDCELKEWTGWTACSKDCDGGTKKRNKFVAVPAEGSGKCADVWSPERLEYKDCNKKSCKVKDHTAAMKCNATLDVLILLDGTPKSGKKGWAAEQKAANQIVDAWSCKRCTAKPQFSILHYTGPRTWSGVKKCAGKTKKKIDTEKAHVSS